MRRRTGRFAPLFGFVALLLVLTSINASASIGWCKRDPIVEIGGNRLHVDVFSTEEILGAATGPTEILISVPRGVGTQLIEQDDGFGFGWRIRFVESAGLSSNDRGIEMRTEVMVPSALDLPVKVEITNRRDGLLEREVGDTNRTVAVKTWV